MNQNKKNPKGVLVPTGRLETLSDGIFAIAMTILVVTIQIRWVLSPVTHF
jgi:uncharacterized membrane protein